MDELSSISRRDPGRIPGPSFFSNFQMPFMSFEEVYVTDKNDSQKSQRRPAYDGFNENFPPKYFHQLESFADRQPIINQSLDHDKDLKDDLDAGDNLFSVYRITTDGRTPYEYEKNADIVYDRRGTPEEVVVYDDMEFSESKVVPIRVPGPTRLANRGLSRPRIPYGAADRNFYQSDMQFRQRFRPPVMRRRSDVHGYAHVDHSHGGYEIVSEDGYDESHAAVAKSDHFDFHGGHGGGGYGHDDHGGHGGGYGHDDHGGGYGGGHDVHGGGYGGGHDIHGGGYGDDHDHGYVPKKKPGPFGYGKPNYKCEYAKETLYVSKTDYKFGKKCYKILKVQCKSKYATGKDIGYKKVCNEFSVTKCRTVYATKFKTKCWLVYKKKCEDVYTTKVDWVYKEKCSTSYEKECHGHGYHKSCHDVPKEICKQVPEKIEKKVKNVKCKKVPDKKCKVGLSNLSESQEIS